MELAKGSKQHESNIEIDFYMFDATPSPHFANQIRTLSCFFLPKCLLGLQDTACAVFRLRIKAQL